MCSICSRGARFSNELGALLLPCAFGLEHDIAKECWSLFCLFLFQRTRQALCQDLPATRLEGIAYSVVVALQTNNNLLIFVLRKNSLIRSLLQLRPIRRLGGSLRPHDSRINLRPFPEKRPRKDNTSGFLSFRGHFWKSVGAHGRSKCPRKSKAPISSINLR